MLRLRKSRFVFIVGLAVAALAAAGLSGCAANSTSSPAAAPVLPMAASLSVCNQTPAGCSTAASYSLGTMRDLGVNVQWSHVPEGTHSATLEVLEPAGGAYQVQNVSFVIAGTNDGSAETNILVPIAGSWVTRRGVTGTWNVRISLDGQNIGTQSVEFQP
jgi:hypothetical protein